MMEILKFVFSSFWIWFGTVVFFAVIADVVLSLGSQIINRKKDK